MINITYLIPIDSLGGSEVVAARGVINISIPFFDFDIQYLCKDISELLRFIKHNMIRFLKK